MGTCTVLIYEPNRAVAERLTANVTLCTSVQHSADVALLTLRRSPDTWHGLIIASDGGRGIQLLCTARSAGFHRPALILEPRIDRNVALEAARNAAIVTPSIDDGVLQQFCRLVLTAHHPNHLEDTMSHWIDMYALTDAEADVLGSAANGETYPQIAHRRGTSPRTVQKHAENLLRKTGDDTLSAAAARLLREVARVTDVAYTDRRESGVIASAQAVALR